MRGPDETMEIEVWVMVNEDGDYAVGDDQSSVVERFWDEIGGDGATRRIKVTLKVPVPKPLELTGVVPEEVSTGELRVN